MEGSRSTKSQCKWKQRATIWHRSPWWPFLRLFSALLLSERHVSRPSGLSLSFSLPVDSIQWTAIISLYPSLLSSAVLPSWNARQKGSTNGIVSLFHPPRCRRKTATKLVQFENDNTRVKIFSGFHSKNSPRSSANLKCAPKSADQSDCCVYGQHNEDGERSSVSSSWPYFYRSIYF